MTAILYRLAVGLFFVLPAASIVSAGSSGTPASVNWTTANPLAVRGRIVQLALYERLLIHVGLVDQSVSAGIIGEVGPESFALNSDSSSQSISIPFTLVRSIRWIEPDKSPRAFKTKQVARELHNTPATIAGWNFATAKFFPAESVMPLTFRLHWSRQTPARNNSSTIEMSLSFRGAN